MSKLIPLFIHVDGEPSDPEDDAVVGYYCVGVDPQLGHSQRASAALDIFHEHWGIEVLDDFGFTVFDAEGNEIEEADDHEGYSLKSAGEFYGPLDPEDLPFTPVVPGP